MALVKSAAINEKLNNYIKEGHDNLEFTKHVLTLQASSSVERLNKLKEYKEYKN